MKILTQKILFGLVGKIGIISLMAICFTMFNSNTQAQTLLVNYDFASAVAGTPCTATPLKTATNVTSIFTTGGTNGETCNTWFGYGMVNPTTGYAFAMNEDANLSVSLNRSGADLTAYFQFQLSGVSAFRGYKLYFQRTRQSAIDIQYSIDGNNFTSFTQIPASLFPDNFPPVIVDLSSITTINNQPTVYFRLVRKNDDKIGSHLTIDNFQVQATTATKSRKRVRFF